MRVLSVIALAFGSANAVSFVGFPSALSCLQADGSSQVKNAAELHTIVTENRATLIDRSAANVASGKCTSLSGVPLYAVSEPSFGGLSYAYNRNTQTYYFCSGSGAATEETGGYPSICEEL